MNLYCTLAAAKRSANESGTSRDVLWLEKIEAASRRIDLFCGRHFFTVSEARYFDGACRPEVWVDDFLSVSALAMDSALDGTFTGETWVEGTDWIARPYNGWPKIGMEMHITGRYLWSDLRRYIKATGVFGYGDGQSASPWVVVAGVTGTLADAADTSMTLSVADLVEAGSTLLIESEQVFVSAVSSTTATVRRGVNGTTAVAHTAAALSLALYPAVVTRACATLAVGYMAGDAHSGYRTERIGDYSYTLDDSNQVEAFLVRALGGLVKII